MLVKIGESFEVEVRGFARYVRIGRRAVHRVAIAPSI
jgi:hypothetical protein